MDKKTSEVEEFLRDVMCYDYMEMADQIDKGLIDKSTFDFLLNRFKKKLNAMLAKEKIELLTEIRRRTRPFAERSRDQWDGLVVDYDDLLEITNDLKSEIQEKEEVGEE